MGRRRSRARTGGYVSAAARLGLAGVLALLLVTLAWPRDAAAASITEYAIPTGIARPTGITTGPDGALWFAAQNANQIGRLTTSGIFTEFALPANSYPNYITTGPDGALWFTAPGNNTIGRLTTGGTVTEFTIPTPGSGPAGIVTGPDGALWFAEQTGNKIGRITTSGIFTEYGNGFVSSPYGITVGSDGNIWFTQINDDKIGMLVPSGVNAGSITLFGLTPGSSPRGIAAGPDGNIWFTESGANSIGNITTFGLITEYGIPTPSSSPLEITAGPDGNLYFTEGAANQIGRITTSGTITEFAVPTADSSPNGITLGPDGDIWFVGYIGNQVGRLLVNAADLSITKTDGVTTATPGGSVTYTITASNAGPGAAVGATVADTLPASLTATWTCVGAGGGTCTAAGSGNINDYVNLPAGGSVTYTVSAVINASATGILSNTATVSAPVGVTDPNPANDSATDTDILIPQADLAITKTNGVTTIIPGFSATYTITASNAGPSSVFGATVADTFPANLTNVTWTCVGAGGGTCTAAGSGNISDYVSLPAGGSVTYTAFATVAPSASGILINTATVSAPGGVTDPNPANNGATDVDLLAPLADLSITKTDGVTTVTAGGSVTYTITASNAGPSNAVGVLVADTLPANLTDATWTCVSFGMATCTVTGSGNISDTVNLPAGESITYTVSATISPLATGTLSNTATVSAPGGVTDPIPFNNSATDTDLILPANNPPTANDDPFTVARNSGATALDVLGNDSAAPDTGETLTIIAVTQPANGSVTFTGGGVSYTPAAGYLGQETFTYTISDGNGGSDTATVTVTVTNTAPVAAADSYSTPQGTALVVAAPGVLANDGDANGDPLAAILVGGPAHGNLLLNPDGSFTYAPAAGYVGPDSFTYQASDGADLSAPATVSLLITATNAAPVAANDAYGTTKNTPLTVAAPGVLANDRDADTNPLSALLVSGPAHGTLILGPDGSFTYTPAAGYVGTDTFAYRASDGTAQSAPATVTIQVGDTATLTLGATGAGSVAASPGSGPQPVGTVVTLTPAAQGGALFVGWLVDGQPAGWASPLMLTLDRDHAVIARFVAPTPFGDVAANDPAATAIRELVGRGIINGYEDGRFGPADKLARAQAAALVVRALGWSGEAYPNPFTDQAPVDDELWRSVAILAHYDVARGYGDGTYRPTATVDHAQFLSLVTRAMVAKGYWTMQPDDPFRFPAVGETGHRQDLITYYHYVGAFPDLTEGASTEAWFGPASRGWSARALWAALDQYSRVDRVP